MKENSSPELLSEELVREKTATKFASFDLMNKKLLVIIPDNTRSAPVDKFFRIFYELLEDSVKKLDYLIAVGTHPLLGEEEKLKRVGITREEKERRYKTVKIMNHRWDEKETFVKIGSINGDEVEELTDGLLNTGVDITINRVIFDYDYLIILGPVFPHEIAGFSGGAKYLFPGICGWDFIDLTHWVAALRTNIKTIGVLDTPSRKLIDRAVRFIAVPKIYFNLVVDEEGLKGLFIGDDRRAWLEAVELSSRINIRYVQKPLERVLSIPSRRYDDFWTGAKAIYKVEPAIADGGELFVYAPHVKEFSITHGKVLDQIGFHIIDYFLEKMDRYKNFPKAVLAYSTLVKGSGRLERGNEVPRIKISLASGIPKEKCEALNMDYRDPDSISVPAWEKEQGERVKVIHNAGEVLYKTLNHM